MADHLREALAKLLDDYDARRRGEREREQQAKDEEAHFLADFAELRRRVIRPVFEAAGAMLEARGHRASIAEQEFVAGAAGRITEAGITLRIVPLGTKAPLHEDQRSLTFATRHYNKTVWINSGESAGSGGLAGAKGAHALEGVTTQLVQDEVIAFVARAIGG
jgi:hypothetical protein